MKSIIKSQDNAGKSQIKLYLPGVGTRNSVGKIVGGITGEGIIQNIAAAYTFLADNYCRGNEIILIGFSRGAFTARSVAGLIGEIGLLNRERMLEFAQIFKQFQDRLGPGGTAGTEREGELLKCTDKDAAISAGAVFDTVGEIAKCIPVISTTIHGNLETTAVVPGKKQVWHDVGLGKHVKRVFHALALDETRIAFAPTLWENPGPETVLKQCWFVGSHSDIGWWL